MKPIIIARKFTVTDDVRERIGKKLSKLDKFFPTDTEATVTLFQERGRETVEITIFRNGTIFRAEETDRTYANALDTAIDILVRKIRKNRTRLEKSHRKDSPILPLEPASEPSEDEEEIRITKYKKFEILPMTPEEAVMQMNLLSHEFYLFRNAENGAINVVYRRKDFEYGIIEPTE